MWNKDLIEFLKDLSLKFSGVTIVLIGEGSKGLPLMLMAVTYEKEKGEAIDKAYRLYIQNSFPESKDVDDMSLGFTTFVTVDDNVPIDSGASIIKGGVLCE